MLLDGHRRRSEAAARGLVETAHPEREEEAGKTHHEKRRLPAVKRERGGAGRKRRIPAVHDEPADSEAEARAEEDAAREKAEHRRALLLGKPVREEGVGRGRGGRLARPDADARESQRSEAAREARERGHEAPERRAPRDQAPPVPGVREAAERNREDGEEDGEDRAIEKAEASRAGRQYRKPAAVRTVPRAARISTG